MMHQVDYISLMNEDGVYIEFGRDAKGRIIELRDELGNTITYEYDAADRKVSEIDALGHKTQFVYNRNGRLKQKIYHNSEVITKSYDEIGNIISETNEKADTTQFDYDALGNLIVVTDPLGNRTQYEYDEANNLVSQIDANGHVTKYEYNSLGKRIAVVLPLGQRSETQYDEVGNIISTTDFNGQTITYEYDDVSLLKAKYYPDSSSISFTYNLEGYIETVTDKRGVTSYNYDSRKRLLSRTDPDGNTISYTYDLSGKISSITTSSGMVEYQYDHRGLVTSVTDTDGDSTSYSFDDVGNLIRTEFPNGIIENREHDERNRLIFHENTNANGNVVSSYRYTLDEVGNRTSVVEKNGRRVDYEYDPCNRLIMEKIFDPGSTEPPRTIEYNYDAVGNRINRTDSAYGTTNYTYDENDRLVPETTNGKTLFYSYDDNGNTISLVSSNSLEIHYFWDAENRLIAVDTNADDTKDIQYHYNNNGERVAKIVNGHEVHFMIDSNRTFAQVLEEHLPNGDIEASYIYGNDLISQDRSGTKSFYLYDGHSGIRMLSDFVGAVTDQYDYDAFGILLNTIGETKNNYLYQGEQFDPNVNFEYLRARYYNQDIGRFISADSFEGIITEPFSRHRYLYTNANPVNFIDPNGNFPLIEAIQTIGIVSILSSIALTAVGGLTNIATSNRDLFEWENGTLSSTGIELGIGVNFMDLTGDICARGLKHEGVNWDIFGVDIGIAAAAGRVTSDVDILKSVFGPGRYLRNAFLGSIVFGSAVEFSWLLPLPPQLGFSTGGTFLSVFLTGTGGLGAELLSGFIGIQYSLVEIITGISVPDRIPSHTPDKNCR